MNDFFTVDNAKNIATVLGTIIVFATVFIVTIKKFIKQALDEINSRKTNWKDLPQRADLDKRILERMEHTKEATNCDRIMIFDFHNGEHFADNRSALKASCTYEVTKFGIDKVQAKAQSIPLSMLSHLLEYLLKKEYFILNPIEAYTEIQPEYYFCKKIGARALVLGAIKDSEGSVIGFMVGQYNSKIDNIDLNSFINLAGYIESTLQDSVKLIKNKKK